jgi:hypothetical protein
MREGKYNYTNPWFLDEDDLVARFAAGLVETFPANSFFEAVAFVRVELRVDRMVSLELSSSSFRCEITKGQLSTEHSTAESSTEVTLGGILGRETLDQDVTERER